MKVWKDENMKGWKYERMTGWQGERIKIWTDERMRGWKYERIKGGWKNERMQDGWKDDGWTKGWKDEDEIYYWFRPIDSRARWHEKLMELRTRTKLLNSSFLAQSRTISDKLFKIDEKWARNLHSARLVRR